MASNKDKKFQLDGKMLLNARIDNCDILVLTGDFVMKDSTISNCRFSFNGPATNIYNLIKLNKKS